MKQKQYFSFTFFIVILCLKCISGGLKNDLKPLNIWEKSRVINNSAESKTTLTSRINSPSDFIPVGYVIFNKKFGDLNNDGLSDCILIIKGTDKAKIMQDEFRGELDQNRRGIIILLKKKDGYHLAAENYSCFSSENEDGGVYFSPELNIEIDKGKLYIHYSHGRYGYWTYSFRYEQSNFKLIGFDQSDNNGPFVHYVYSYNFITNKKLTKENINFYSETPEDEKFKETWEAIEKIDLIRLSAIEDFDNLRFE
jgi:hypothetical protein